MIPWQISSENTLFPFEPVPDWKVARGKQSELSRLSIGNRENAPIRERDRAHLSRKGNHGRDGGQAYRTLTHYDRVLAVRAVK